MANIGYATLSVIPSLKGFGPKLRLGMAGPLSAEGAKAGEQSGRSFSSTFAKFAAVGVAASGVVALGKSVFDAAIESQKVTKQTEAVLKSMGTEAGHTSESIADLSEKLSLQSGVDDELIQSSQNVLLTFGKVQNKVGKGNKVFDRGAQAALDMSVALGTDLQGATIQVGKALNDPLKGITALGRAGVSFTAQQKEQIKTLVASGKTLEAQKIILSELENQFGGSAAAQATAGDRLRVAFGNLQEQVGTYLVPVVEKAAQFLAERLPGAMAAAESFVKEELVPALKELWHWFEERILPTLTSVANFIRDEVLPRLVSIGEWIIDNEPVLQGLAITVGVYLAAAFLSWAASAAAAAFSTFLAIAPVLLIAVAIAALTAGLIYAYQNWGWFKTGVDFAVDAMEIAVEVVQTLYGWVDTLADRLSDAFGMLERLPGVPGGGNGLIGTAGDLVGRGLRNILLGPLAPFDVAKDLLGFDKGGMVPGPLNKERLILAHGGETVLPTHNRDWIRSLDYGNYESPEMVVRVDGTDRDLVRMVEKWFRTTGLKVA